MTIPYINNINFQTKSIDLIYFDLNGNRRGNPENGIFIMVKKGKTSKVVR